jgi:ankyrin repeat protein
MWAASQKHPEAVKVLLAHKADVSPRSDTYEELVAIEPHAAPGNSRSIPRGGDTALMFAARSGDAASAKLLLDAGANPSGSEAWGVSATTLATHSNFTEVAILLLDRGADPNAEKAGMTALHNAVMHRNERMVAALLAHGANPNVTVKNWTPNRRTADDFNYTRELVGATPLWLAARWLSPGIMKMLLDKGADPLFILRSEHYTQGAEFTNVFHKNITTPLMAALGMGAGRAWVEVSAAEKEALTMECVKLATAPGVDLNLANDDGKTALDAAKGLRYDAVVNLLTDLGARAGAPAAPGGARGRGARGPQ